DGKRWLSLFNRFATCHSWDDSFKLAFVPYYFRDTAQTWLDNQEFSSWSVFEAEFRKAYADDFTLAQQATEELRSRAQRQGETCHVYVQAVLQLCRASDHTMSEQQKVAHVLKDIAENVFYLIFQQNFSSVDDVLTYCRKLDRELSRRIPA